MSTKKKNCLVGRPVIRVDAADKAAGKTRYLNDLPHPGALFGVLVRSNTPRGILQQITLDPAFNWRNITVATAADIPGINVVHMHDRTMPLMAAIGAEIRYRGEPIAIVAAKTREQARAAAAAVHFTIQPLPPLLTLDAAIKIFKKSPAKLDTLKAQNIQKGNVQQGFKNADFILTREYRAGHQEQLYLEPQGLIVTPQKDGGILVEGSIQCPYFPVHELNDALRLPPEKIRVRQTPMGGAFGGKEDYPSMLAGYAAIAARKAKKPVLISYDRHEDILFTPKRHPVWVRFKAGCKKNGTLTAIECDFILDGGAYLTLSDVVLYRGILHCALAYRCPNVLIRGKAIRTHSMPCGAFRGFGAPQAIWGLESLIDEIAARVGQPPHALRLRLHARPGDVTPTGQILTPDNGSTAVLRRAIAQSHFPAKFYAGSRGRLRPGETKLHGIGIAFFAHGSAFTGDGEAKFKAKGRVHLARLPNGKPGVVIRVSSTEMGQGVQTVFRQIASDALGLPMDSIDFPLADTGLAPDSGPTVASRTTMVVGNVVHQACLNLKQQLLAWTRSTAPTQTFAFPRAAQAALNAGKNFSGSFEFLLPPSIRWNQDTFQGDAYPGYSWSANVAEVEIDPLTCELRVTRVTDVIDIGRVINPMTASGQVEGGLTQALGYATLEQIATGKNGLYDASRLQTYIIPTALDIPEFHVSFVEYPCPFAPPGAKGLGELPMDGLAPAIANAIENAAGIRLRTLPLTPEAIFAALHQKTKTIEPAP